MIAFVLPLVLFTLADIAEVIGIVYLWTDDPYVTGQMTAQYLAIGMLILQLPLCFCMWSLSKKSKRVWTSRVYLGQIILVLAIFTTTSIDWRRWPSWFL